MRYALPLMLIGTPALAASGPFFSLANTDFIVTVAFLLFIGILLYLKVPGMLSKMLDDRAEGIRNDLDEARALREEAQTLLASYERKTREARDQAAEIVAAAKAEAEAANVQARADLEDSVARRLAAATDQIDSARAAAVRDVRDQAIAVASAVAAEVVAKQMSATDANKLIDDAIGTVETKLH
ncbi:ATP synthase subunit b [Jannaschia pagri]|uniref:ATP synthase subunit b n=1 Tax=Jannaschia pagri TaxID=2829797 RepID=A0ABQ4NKA6_9RHOB|nr:MULTISPECIES: F0F1 ATP synthase subunit B [unclassified Jannaschia]GIT91016.1 ATP synthase subunit b [Jannaschia sp. AI_61]GIT94848.1 ATP synthase subunit b [Jannaschia sp. AI_62]